MDLSRKFITCRKKKKVEAEEIVVKALTVQVSRPEFNPPAPTLAILLLERRIPKIHWPDL